MIEVLVKRGASPVSLEEAKEHLRIINNDHDGLIQSSIETALDFIESYTGRAFLEQTWDLVFSGFPEWITVPRAPLISVVAASFTYVSVDGVVTQVPAMYDVDTDSTPGRVLPSYNQTWPTVRSVTDRAVRCRVKCGYARRELIPPVLIHAQLMAVQAYVDERPELLTEAKKTAWPYRVFS